MIACKLPKKFEITVRRESKLAGVVFHYCNLCNATIDGPD